MKLFLLAVVSCLAVSVIVKAQDCTALANAGNCDFYTQCVEARFQCGTNGYPRGYGDRYCHQFTNKQSCFTSAVSIQHSSKSSILLNFIHRVKCGSIIPRFVL